MGGIDPVWLMTCDDPHAVRVAFLVARRRFELEERRDENQAVLNANAVGKMIGG